MTKFLDARVENSQALQTEFMDSNWLENCLNKVDSSHVSKQANRVHLVGFKWHAGWGRCTIHLQ